jgi:hypothetical protein
VEILLHNTSTKRSPNQAPFNKISKSGDGGGSGGSFTNLDNLTIIWLRLTKEVLKSIQYFQQHQEKLLSKILSLEGKIDAIVEANKPG